MMARFAAILAGLLVGCWLAAPAGANTISKFSLTGGAFDTNGIDGPVNGTFTLDLTTHQVLDASITTPNGAFILGTTYTGFPLDSFTTSATETQLIFHNSATALPGVAGQILTLNIFATDLSGMQSFAAVGNEAVYFVLCGGLCASRQVYVLVETSSITTTPIPGGLPLLATALGGMGVLGWRRKRQTGRT
jgi:hypothetical protein